MHSLARSFSVAFFVALPVVHIGCSSAPDSPASTESTATTNEALTYDDAVSRAEQWSNAKLKYCQAPNGGRDYDTACSTYCSRQSNPLWDPYRSDCSGLVSWAWALPAPGRVTGQFAPFQTDITHAITASTLRAGDAVNNSDHIMLFKEWVTAGSKATFIEEPGCSVTPNYAHEFTSTVTLSGDSIHVAYNGMTFTAIRYGALTVPPPPNMPPRGAMDTAKCDAIVGWAQDQDAPAAPLKVVLDFDAAAGKTGMTGTVSTTANVHRTDLCTAINSCNHGFSVAMPLGLQDGKAHTVYAYGDDDSVSGVTTLLPGAPKTFTCAPPAVPLSPTAGIKRWIASPTVLGAWKLDELLDVAREPKATVDGYPKGPDLPAKPVAVIADDGSPEVWVIDGTTRRHVVDPASLTSWNLTVAKWPAAKVQAIAQGADWPHVRFAFLGVGDPAVYVLDSAPVVAVPDGGAPQGSSDPQPGGGNAGAGDPSGNAPAPVDSNGCAIARGESRSSSLPMILGAALALAFARRRRAR
jgi:hypothetical protein